MSSFDVQVLEIFTFTLCWPQKNFELFPKQYGSNTWKATCQIWELQILPPLRYCVYKLGSHIHTHTHSLTTLYQQKWRKKKALCPLIFSLLKHSNIMRLITTAHVFLIPDINTYWEPYPWTVVQSAVYLILALFTITYLWSTSKIKATYLWIHNVWNGIHCLNCCLYVKNMKINYKNKLLPPILYIIKIVKNLKNYCGLLGTCK